MFDADADPWASHPPLVPDDFVVPGGLVDERFVLEPLAVRHNTSDLAAWSSSIGHIRATPGFPMGGWPDHALTPEENEADLARHARHFDQRVGFTYTVLDPASGEVVGCVYLYPTRTGPHDVTARSWVRADRAALDEALHRVVARWLADDWPFTSPDYVGR